MVDVHQIATELISFAEAQVKQLVARSASAWTREQIDDGVQDLFLAGWTDWRQTGDEGLAKNRIASRIANLARAHGRQQRRQDRSASLTDVIRDGQRDIPERRRREPETDPMTVAIKRHLAQLPERERMIVQMCLSGLTHEEIADELKLGLRTIQRVFANLKEEKFHVETQ